MSAYFSSYLDYLKCSPPKLTFYGTIFMDGTVRYHSKINKSRPRLVDALQLVSYPDPTLCEERVWWHLSTFLVLASSAFLFSHKPIRLQVYDFHVILHLVAKQHCTRSAVLVSNPNTALRFCNHCIATCNQRVIDCITLRLSHAPVQPRNHSNVTRPSPCGDYRLGTTETTLQQVIVAMAINTSTKAVQKRFLLFVLPARLL